MAWGFVYLRRSLYDPSFASCKTHPEKEHHPDRDRLYHRRGFFDGVTELPGGIKSAARVRIRSAGNAEGSFAYKLCMDHFHKEPDHDGRAVFMAPASICKGYRRQLRKERICIVFP